jgi:hypothetical protein
MIASLLFIVVMRTCNEIMSGLISFTKEQINNSRSESNNIKSNGEESYL